MVIHHKQVSLLDCGLACSKTLLSVYGIDDIDIEKFFNKNSDQGMSLLDIELLLKRFSIKSTSYEVDNFSLIQKIDSPFIALVNRSGLPHYIVVIKNNNGVLTISDPSQSEITKITMLDFKSIFAGVVLIPKNNSSVNKEKRHEDFTKESTISHELYQKFIDSLYLKQKFSLFFFGILKVVLPIVMSLVLQYVTVNVISLAVSNQIFIITSVLLSLLIFKIISNLEVVLKTDIENQFLYETLEKYYYSRLEDYSEEKNYDFTVGYFWNLLTSVSGIFQKFYLKIYIVMFVIIMVFLASFNLLFFIVTLLSLILLWVYNYFKVLQLEKNQRDFVSTSSNFTYLVESSIDGLYDISSFDKSLEFKNEFKQRMKELLDVKLESALITNLVNTSVQVFIVGLASTFIVITNFYYINSSFIDYSNSVLLILLLSTVIQPLLNIWIVFHRSRYSLDFINFSDNDTKSSQIKEKKILPFDKITKIELINLSMSYKEKNIFSNLNFNFKSGEIYVISGVNGSGKSTLLKILEGFKSPVNGKIVINDVSYDTLEDTNIVEYIGIYSTEFRLFSGSVDRNIKFDLFSKDFKVDLGQNSFLNLSNNYQINSQGKNLSQGQQQKILILRALENHKKDIYFLDEPTSNLDESSKQILLEKLKELRSKNKIICIITHDEYIKKIASEILYLGE